MSTGFYIVISDTRGPSLNPHRHESFAQAVQEASRLARCQPGDTFYVMQTVKAVNKRDVDIIDMTPSDAVLIEDGEIPF